jgi:hypothetical protein
MKEFFLNDDFDYLNNLLDVLCNSNNNDQIDKNDLNIKNIQYLIKNSKYNKYNIYINERKSQIEQYEKKVIDFDDEKIINNILEKIDENNKLSDDKKKIIKCNIVDKQKENKIYYISKIKSEENKLNDYMENKYLDKNYIKYLELLKIIKPYLDQWNTYRKNFGKICSIKGKNFEKKCFYKGMKKVKKILAIVHNCKINDIKYKKNVINKKNNICISEYDIIVYKKNDIIAIIECKSNIYDICTGYRHLIKNALNDFGKKHIIDNNIMFFIISQTNDLNNKLYKYENNLLIDLCKYMIGFNFTNTQGNDDKIIYIYNKLITKYENEISPKEWFLKYHDKYLIII